MLHLESSLMTLNVKHYMRIHSKASDQALVRSVHCSWQILADNNPGNPGLSSAAPCTKLTVSPSTEGRDCMRRARDGSLDVVAAVLARNGIHRECKAWTLESVLSCSSICHRPRCTVISNLRQSHCQAVTLTICIAITAHCFLL